MSLATRAELEAALEKSDSAFEKLKAELQELSSALASLDELDEED